MSFRSKPIPPARHRSSSATRSASSGTSNPSMSFSRPRSIGLFSSNSTPFSSYTSPSSAYSSPYSSYSSNYKSPYFSNGYRGNSGYASLTIPSKALSNINIYARDYDTAGNRSRSISRQGSFNRDRSVSKSRSPSVISGMGSRSISLTSLNSEGYISGNDRSSRSSRIGSSNDLILRCENGEIDYKKLYEQQLTENDRIKDKFRKSEEELRDTKQTLEKLNTVTSKNSLSELEKRERRAMERKLSEMEEELKQLQKLKAENERLRAENRALTRVVSKLSNTAKNSNWKPSETKTND